MTFITTFLVLRMFAWGPILKALDERTEKIQGDIDGAEKSRTEADALKADLEQQLSGAREQVVAIVEEGKRDANVAKDEILGEARDEAKAIKDRATRETELAAKGALENVWDTAADLSTDLAGRIIGKSLDSKDHQELILSVIGEYKAAQAGS